MNILLGHILLKFVRNRTSLFKVFLRFVFWIGRKKFYGPREGSSGIQSDSVSLKRILDFAYSRLFDDPV